jgi:hypothetical protein
MKTAIVGCKRDGKSIASYKFGYGGALLTGPVPPADKLIADAKDNLLNDRIARPPYHGITFEVRFVD